MTHFHKLTVSEVQKLTPNSVRISFDVPDDLRDTFQFAAGQYITIRYLINGKEMRRPYSLCSSAGSGNLSIGVKKVKDGSFSVHANEQLKAGDTLEVMPPEGKFTLTPDTGKAGRYLAFAAGSGITPVLSIVKTVLEEESQSTFTLVYGNQSLEETMFSEVLHELEVRYPDRFVLEYIFSRRKEEKGLFGRIDRSNVNYLLKNKFFDTDFDTYFLCGPEPMIRTVEEILLERGVSEENIRFELFSPPAEEKEEVVAEGQSKITVILDGDTETFIMKRDQPVLNACLDHGLDAPYSCQGGICSTCIARITDGKAEMRQNQILTDDEIEEGLILTCQAHPLTSRLTVDYDDV